MAEQITSLYKHFKNTPKKLKIVCDWDEVIQACEPYAYFETWKAEGSTKEEDLKFFPKYFRVFWENENSFPIEYSNFGSHSKPIGTDSPTFREKQQEIKNSPNFYQQTPFLTIAEDLLKLIKEDKVEKLIFLSAYDKRKFPDRDKRKFEIFSETFGKNVDYLWISVPNDGVRGHGYRKRICDLKLIGFDSEIQSSERTSVVGDQTQGQSKADWIKENASDFDIFIDDNPNICKNVIKNNGVDEPCKDCSVEYEKAEWSLGKKITIGKFGCVSGKCLRVSITVLAPCYPAIENQHHSEVILIKQEVSNLKKEDFGK